MEHTAYPRSAGVLIPLFSIRNDRSWGIGEFPDIAAIAPWLEQARLRTLMLLPLLETALGQTSPYGALSAFALDPIYLSLEDVPDFAELGGENALSPDERATLDGLRALPKVQYGPIRELKQRWLRRSFERFQSSGASGSHRARAFKQFRDQHAGWLFDYSLFRALKDENPNSWWMAWDPALKARRHSALESARTRVAADCAYFEYVQWLAFEQLGEARRRASRHQISLAGDLPFMVAEDSADAWARQKELLFDVSVGAPPDAYSADGQDWGLPVYKWKDIAAGGYEWLRQRGERTAEAFDFVRVDHVVGFYRTYARPKDKSPAYFSPSDEQDQREQGEAVMRALGAGGTRIIAEDLGTVPPFVRQSLTANGIPGFRVLRWEKDDALFRDPANWPALSVATTGTHDTETLAEWWDALQPAERQAVRAVPALRALADADAQTFGPHVHHALLAAVYGSGSNLLLPPIQDLLGIRGRVNLPGTVNDDNWSYRLPWTVSELQHDSFVRERTLALAELARRFGR